MFCSLRFFSFFFTQCIFSFLPHLLLKNLLQQTHSFTFPFTHEFPFFCSLIILPVLPHLQSCSLPLSFPVEFSNQIAQNAASFFESNLASVPRKTREGDDYLFLEQPLFSYAKSVGKWFPSCLKVARYRLKYWPLCQEKKKKEHGGRSQEMCLSGYMHICIFLES